jgi:hypothetical protein
MPFLAFTQWPPKVAGVALLYKNIYYDNYIFCIICRRRRYFSVADFDSGQSLSKAKQHKETAR